MRTKSLEPELLDRVRERARTIVSRDFGGIVQHAAQKIGISQSQLNDLLNGKKGVGLPFLLSIADYEGTSLDEVLGRNRGGWTVEPAADPTARVEFFAHRIASIERAIHGDREVIDSLRHRMREAEDELQRHVSALELEQAGFLSGLPIDVAEDLLAQLEAAVASIHRQSSATARFARISAISGKRKAARVT